MIRVVDTLTMIEVATQRNFDSHDVFDNNVVCYSNEGVQGSIALQCPKHSRWWVDT